MTAKKGDQFTHLHALDPSWNPGPGEKYADGPRAKMVVTRTSRYVSSSPRATSTAR